MKEDEVPSIPRDAEVLHVWSADSTTVTYGGPRNLWGADSLQSWDINSTNFGVAISGQETDGDDSVCQVYYFKMTVYYSAAFKFNGGDGDDNTDNDQNISYRWPQYAGTCASCHAGDFDAGEHRGGLSNNLNCGDSGCHRVSDRNWD